MKELQKQLADVTEKLTSAQQQLMEEQKKNSKLEAELKKFTDHTADKHWF